MAVQQAIYGQSNYDLCLQMYGNLDLLVKLAIDNNINDLGLIINNYTYDPNNTKILSNNIGYYYASNFDSSQIVTGVGFWEIENTFIIS